MTQEMRMDLFEVEQKVRGLFYQWEWMLIKFGWSFDVLYYNSQDDLGHKEWQGIDYDCAMFCKVKFQYLKGTIYVILDQLAQLSDDELERAVVHELTHFLIDPLQEDEGNLEYTTETISRVIYTLSKASNGATDGE